MTLEEVAAYLRIHIDTVRRWAREGTLPAVKLGKAYRVNSGDLQVWWNERLAQRGVHGVAERATAERSDLRP